MDVYNGSAIWSEDAVTIRNRLLVVALALAMLTIPQSAAAQIDLNGVWAPIFHEDQPERVPGPELGDYAGRVAASGMRRPV
jgi:hypothetical protein